MGVTDTRTTARWTLESWQPEALRNLVGTSLPSSGLLLDDRGKILVCGPTLPAFLPRPDELLHAEVAQIPPPVLGESLAKLWRECRESGEPALTEVVLSLDPTRQADPISTSLRVARHPDCETAYLVTIREVSQKRRRVQALLDQVDTLERQTKSWEAAAQTARHDLLSCLAALKGFIELTLRHRDLPSAAVDTLRQAHEIAAQVGAIADRIQISAPQPLPEAPAALEALGHRLFRALQAAHPDIAFTWCVQAPEISTNLPSDVLWEVLWNLLSNSVKYRREDRLLHIDLRVGVESGRIWMEVRDNGRGVPPGEEEVIFGRGRRGSNATHLPGTGVGLYSARQLLERYRGSIRAEPHLDGAVVRASFPSRDCRYESMRNS